MRSFRVATINNVDIKIHPTLVLALAWFTWFWGFSATDIGRSTVYGVIFGISQFAIIFGSVLMHEFAHAWVARRNGCNVNDITLSPIGGIASIQMDHETPGTEFRVVLAGPASNFLVALLLTPAVYLLFTTSSGADPAWMSIASLSITGLILQVWLYNLFIGIFNLLPMFPMDGGRLFRATMQFVIGPLLATRIAVAFSYVLAVVLGVIALREGWWTMALIAGFVLIGSQEELRQIEVFSKLRRLTVGQFALWEGGGIHPDADVSTASRFGPGDIAVVDGKQLVGMLRRADLRQLERTGVRQMLVRDVMHPAPYAVGDQDSVYDVVCWLNESAYDTVPVVDFNGYRGIFTLDRFEHVHATLSKQHRSWLRDAGQLVLSMRQTRHKPAR